MCLLDKNKGPCKAYIRKWYFNSGPGKCEKFMYGGCGGNANNFDSKSACEQKCQECRNQGLNVLSGKIFIHS